MLNVVLIKVRGEYAFCAFTVAFNGGDILSVLQDVLSFIHILVNLGAINWKCLLWIFRCPDRFIARNRCPILTMTVKELGVVQ